MYIQIENFSKSYGDIRAVDGISLSINQGEMFGLLGPDGAGKTTTIRTLCTLLIPDAGSCRIKNLDVVRDYRTIRQMVGYMPQRFSLYPDLTVAENMRFFADLFQVPHQEREERLGQLLEFSKLGPFQRRRASALSGGMKQKLALSCTLIHTPELLFLDEPTTGVDPVSRREFWRILKSLKDQGVTIFITTSYMDEALKCDQVAFMHKGKILATGKPAELVKYYPYSLFEVWADKIIAAVSVLHNFDDIKNIQIFGDKLHLAFPLNHDPERELRQFLEEEGYHNLQIKAILPGIEDTFIELMKQ